MTQPLISIVTITRNSEAVIDRTIRSVVSQDYAHKEYIIVDGASTDDTMQVVDRYRDSIDNILSEPDNGISDAFNKGIRLSHGELIVFINADDTLLPGVLSQVAALYDGHSDVCCCPVIMEDAVTGFRCREVPSTRFPRMPFLCHVAHQGMFVSRRCYDRVGGYDMRLRWPMDLDMMMRITASGGTFQRLDNVDAAVFRSGGTTSQAGIWRKRHDYLYMVRKNRGSWLEAWIFYGYLLLTQFAKRILDLFGGKNFGQRLRYKHE